MASSAAVGVEPPVHRRQSVLLEPTCRALHDGQRVGAHGLRIQHVDQVRILALGQAAPQVVTDPEAAGPALHHRIGAAQHAVHGHVLVAGKALRRIEPRRRPPRQASTKHVTSRWRPIGSDQVSFVGRRMPMSSSDSSYS